MEFVPKLEYQDNSPHKLSLAPKPNEALGKPPGRISPFKGKMSHLTANEVFATTPRRILNFKTQSVDRTGFNGSNTHHKTEIKFDNLKRLAPSRTLATPSRMIVGKRKPQSEQISRLNRPTVASALKNGKEPNTNLMEKFKSNRSILKRTLDPPSEEEEYETKSTSSDISLDRELTTTLNTMKNTGEAKNVLTLLSDAGSEISQTKKRKVAVKFDEIKEITNSDIMEALQSVLRNQENILRRLDKIESKIMK